MKHLSRAVASVVLFFFTTFQVLLGGAPVARAEDAPVALLSVSANVTGAKVLVDGKLVGVTPLTTASTAGTHQVRVEAPGYEPFTRSIQVSAGRKLVVEATLVRVAGGLEVQVNVAGAQVFLNDRAVGTGQTVRVDPLDPGTYVLRVEKPGYETWKGKVTVFRGQVLAVPVVLGSAFGALAVETDPPGATVTVDGRDRGRSPVSVDELEHGLHSVKTSLPGYADTYQSVRVERQRRASLRVALPREAGTLVVHATPGQPRLSLDGYDLGEHGELTLRNLAAGVHNVRASLPGYTEALGTVEVTPGGTAELALKLNPVGSGGDLATVRATAPRDGRRALPWVILGVAVAAGAGVGIAIAANAQAAPPSGTEGINPPEATLGVALP